MMNKFGKELGEYLEFANINNNEFAERIGTTPKNLIDIIAGNISLSQNMIYNISFVTDIPVSYIENVESDFKLNQVIDSFLKENNLTIKEYANRFSPKEFSEKYNVSFTDERNNYNIIKDIFKYLRITKPSTIYTNNSATFYKSKNDKPELLALWLERCYKMVMGQSISEYKPENILIIVSQLKSMALKNELNEEKLIKLFNDNGIYLAIQDDLKGSKIRGAFKVLGDKPAIYITKKHKRYADIYFALFHELAHCKSDYNRAQKGSLISLFDSKESEEYEIKADKQAFTWMVDEKIYDSIKYDYNNLDKYDVIPSFLAYRLAYDHIITYSSDFYQNNNNTIN